MRIHFTDGKRPKYVAKQVRDVLNLFLDPALPRITLSGARQVTARMFGYRDWHELDRLLGTHPASLHDEDCPEDIVRARRARQAEALTIPGVFPDEAALAAGVLLPSSRRPGKASRIAIHPPKSGANVNYVKAMREAMVEPLNLKSMSPAHMIVLYKAERVSTSTFHADPPRVKRLPPLRLRQEHFRRIPRDPGPDLEAA